MSPISELCNLPKVRHSNKVYDDDDDNDDDDNFSLNLLKRSTLS